MFSPVSFASVTRWEEWWTYDGISGTKYSHPFLLVFMREIGFGRRPKWKKIQEADVSHFSRISPPVLLFPWKKIYLGMQIRKQFFCAQSSPTSRPGIPWDPTLCCMEWEDETPNFPSFPDLTKEKRRTFWNFVRCVVLGPHQPRLEFMHGGEAAVADWHRGDYKLRTEKSVRNIFVNFARFSSLKSSCSTPWCRTWSSPTFR